jgi:hypothetical protein
MFRMSGSKLVACCAGVWMAGALTSTCSSNRSAQPSDQSASLSKSVSFSKPGAESRSPELWGDLKPVVSVKELMRDLLDPIADNIFDSVKSVVTKNGVEETVPKTDGDWEKIRIGGVTMAEGVSLLKIRRPFAPPGDLNNSTGPDAVELAPDQITAKVEKDPVEWNARIEALRNVGLEVLDIVKRKDVQELWDASYNLDQACENCHRSYWYPLEDTAFYEKLDRRLSEYARSSSPNAPAKTRK